MAVPELSLRDTIAQIITNIEQATGQTTPSLPVAYNRVLANAMGAQSITNRIYFKDQRKEVFPQTSSEVGLTLWGELISRPRTPAIATQLEITVTSPIEGFVIGVGANGPRWLGSNGIVYSTVTAAAPIESGTALIIIKAVEGGAVGNLIVGAELNLVSAFGDLDTKATVTLVTTVGEEIESIEVWRVAILDRLRTPDLSGTVAYFHFRALEVDGITDAFPYVSEDLPGAITIHAVAETNTNGTPTAQQLVDISAVFDTAFNNILWATGTLPGGTARLTVIASGLTEFNLVTNGFPLNAKVIEAVNSAVTRYFDEKRPFISGLTLESDGFIDRHELVGIIADEAKIIDPSVEFASISLQLNTGPGIEVSNRTNLDEGQRVKVNITHVTG